MDTRRLRRAIRRRSTGGNAPGLSGVVADHDSSCRARSALRDDETVDTTVAHEEGDVVIAQTGAAATGDDGGAADVDEVILSRRDWLVLAAEGFVPEHSLDLGCRIAYPDAAIGAAKLVDCCGLHLSATARDREHHQRSNGELVGRLRHCA